MEYFQSIVKSKTSPSRSQNGTYDIQTTPDYFYNRISSTQWLPGELEFIIDDLVVDRNPKLTLRHWHQGTETLGCPASARHSEPCIYARSDRNRKGKYTKRTKTLYTGYFAVKLLCTVGINIVPSQAVQMQSDNDFVIQVRQFRSS